MAKFQRGDRVIYSPAGTSIEMQMGATVTRIYDPKPSIPQQYGVRSDGGALWQPVDEDELTALSQ